MDYIPYDFGGVSQILMSDVPPVKLEFGTKWLNTRDGIIYTWMGSEWAIEDDDE